MQSLFDMSQRPSLDKLGLSPALVSKADRLRRLSAEASAASWSVDMALYEYRNATTEEARATASARVAAAIECAEAFFKSTGGSNENHA